MEERSCWVLLFHGALGLGAANPLSLQGQLKRHNGPRYGYLAGMIPYGLLQRRLLDRD